MPAAAPSTDVFRAIADPTRRAVLDLLRHKERTVNELVQPFKMSQPAVSQHLSILREAGLVTVKQRGRERVYQVEQKPLRQVYDWLSHYQQFWEAKLGHKFNFCNKPNPAVGFDGIIHCEVKECEPPRRLSIAWEGAGIATMVSFTLSAAEFL